MPLRHGPLTPLHFASLGLTAAGLAAGAKLGATCTLGLVLANLARRHAAATLVGLGIGVGVGVGVGVGLGVGWVLGLDVEEGDRHRRRSGSP